MNTTIFHYKLGTDGVSLEIKKRTKILKRLGVKPYTIAGEGNADFIVPEIGLNKRSIIRFNKYAFETSDAKRAKRLFSTLERKAEKKLNAALDEINPKFIVVHNMFSLAYNLPASYALAKVIQERNIKTEAIHHDFWWDREIFKSNVSFVRDLMLDVLPPNIPQIISHVVINSIEREKLLKRRGIKAKVFGDLFEFESTDGSSKETIKNLLKIKEHVVFLQASRIVRRKAIEVAVDLVSEFTRSSGKRAVLLLTNPPEKYVDAEYHNLIKEYARAKGVKFIEAYKKARNIKFFEFYKIADFAVYPTIKEGFGNQFLEACYYKVLPIIFEYEVFRKDLKKEGYSYISLGKRYRIVEGLVRVPEKTITWAAKKALYYLRHPERYKEVVQRNYKIAEKYHSPKVLENYYKLLLTSIRMEYVLHGLKEITGLSKKDWKEKMKKLLKYG